jgi:hypothetical protein
MISIADLIKFKYQFMQLKKISFDGKVISERVSKFKGDDGAVKETKYLFILQDNAEELAKISVPLDSEYEKDGEYTFTADLSTGSFNGRVFTSVKVQ